MSNPSRNSPCPCGSGKRYKHCCGADPRPDSDASSPNPSKTFDILNRAVELQKAGREEEAAQLYEAVIALEPNNPDAHNMLAVILAEQWRMPDAMHHANLAGELTNWSDPYYYRNYIPLMRKALGNVENARIKQMRVRYLEAFGAQPVQPEFPPTISILIFEQASAPELSQCLKRLSEQVMKPHEVLISSDSAEVITSVKWPFPVRIIDLPPGTSAERINLLADAASGEFILALPKGDTLLPDHLLRLAGAVGSSGRWVFAFAAPLEAETTILVDEPPTNGFMLLSRTDRLVTESNLLVQRELHQCIGGYDPLSPAPALDYCLRLLWEKEPAAIQNETCLPVASRANSPERLAVIGNYFEKAFSDALSPNPFAPTKPNWGSQLHLHIADHRLFVSMPFMAVMKKDVEECLQRKQKQRLASEPGVNLIGPVQGGFGLGENMRAFARASLEGRIPCEIRDINLALPTRQADGSPDQYPRGETHHNCSIFFFNPDVRQLYSRSLDAVVFERPSVDFAHTKIGYWFWELEKISPQWDYAFARVDEIWVATEFIANAMRRATDKPVTKIPTPIGFEIKGKYDRNYFGIPSNTFIFLFSFDFNGFFERKNPYALIRAFQRAFPRYRQDVALVIKSVNGTKQPEAMRTFLEQGGGDPRILLRNEFMSRDEVYGLQSVVDAYVSLHRAEGFGLGLAECMYQGKPVIGTAYSGNLEFMNESNSGLVNYSLVPIRKGEYLYDDPGFFWAQPDEEHAAYLMAKLVEDATYRNRIAAQGREDIRRDFNYAVIAERMKARLQEIGVL